MPPVSDRQKRRACELLGLGASFREAAKATDMSPSTLEKLVAADASYRSIRDNAKKSTLAADVKGVLQELLTSGNDTVRAKGAELLLKYRDELEDVEAQEPEDVLLPGCYIVFPAADDDA